MHLPRLWTDASVAIQKLKGRKLITGKGCAHIQHRPPHKCALSLTQVLLAQVSKAPVDHLARCLVASRAQLLAEFAPRHNRRPRYDRKWPPCHNASPLCAQNSHRATTGDHDTIENGHRATTPAHFVHKIRTAPQQKTTLRSKMATAPQASPLCRATTRDHVTIQNYQRVTRAHSITTSSSAERTIYFNSLKRAKHVAAACHFLIITCFKCCVCHAK